MGPNTRQSSWVLRLPLRASSKAFYTGLHSCHGSKPIDSGFDGKSVAKMSLGCIFGAIIGRLKWGLIPDKARGCSDCPCALPQRPFTQASTVAMAANQSTLDSMASQLKRQSVSSALNLLLVLALL